jgi:hypothetical protein
LHATTGVAYHFLFFTAINPAAWVFGALCLIGSLLFAWVGEIRNELRFRRPGGLRAAIGGTLIVYAVIVHPLLGYLHGHRYPYVPTFGVPCLTTIFTLGVLLFAARPLPRSVFAVPLLWSAVGPSRPFDSACSKILVCSLRAVLALRRSCYRWAVNDY